MGNWAALHPPSDRVTRSGSSLNGEAVVYNWKSSGVKQLLASTTTPPPKKKSYLLVPPLWSVGENGAFHFCKSCTVNFEWRAAEMVDSKWLDCSPEGLRSAFQNLSSGSCNYWFLFDVQPQRVLFIWGVSEHFGRMATSALWHCAESQKKK